MPISHSTSAFIMDVIWRGNVRRSLRPPTDSVWFWSTCESGFLKARELNKWQFEHCRLSGTWKRDLVTDFCFVTDCTKGWRWSDPISVLDLKHVEHAVTSKTEESEHINLETTFNLHPHQNHDFLKVKWLIPVIFSFTFLSLDSNPFYNTFCISMQNTNCKIFCFVIS